MCVWNHKPKEILNSPSIASKTEYIDLKVGANKKDDDVGVGKDPFPSLEAVEDFRMPVIFFFFFGTRIFPPYQLCTPCLLQSWTGEDPS